MTEPFAMEGSVTPQPLLFMFACLKGLLWRCQAVMRWVILGLTGSCMQREAYSHVNRMSGFFRYSLLP